MILSIRDMPFASDDASNRYRSESIFFKYFPFLMDDRGWLAFYTRESTSVKDNIITI
jgi:hypothetical protein